MQKTSQKGFTLVELMIYALLFSVIILLLTEVFISTIESRLESEATSYVAIDSRSILSQLMRDITLADAVSTPSSLGEMSALLELQTGGIHRTYTLVNNDLVISDGVSNNVLNGVGSKVTNLSFKRIGNVGGKPTIQIKFTIESTTKRVGKSEIRNFQTTVGLR